MSKILDFRKMKKAYMTVTLDDGKNTTLMVGMPTKAVMDEFVSMQRELSADNMGDEAIESLYEICAKILSRNKAGIEITKADLEECFDFEDVIFFIREYSEFISNIANAKN